MSSIKDFFSKCDQIRSFHRSGHIYWINRLWKTSFLSRSYFLICFHASVFQSKYHYFQNTTFFSQNPLFFCFALMQLSFWQSQKMQGRYTVTWLNMSNELFHDGGPYHIETSPLIYTANQWTGFYMIGLSAIKVL